MTAKQVRIRRDTNANVMAYVAADGELWFDTDNDRVHVGDSISAGGVLIPNFRDVQKNTITAAIASGTVDALTLTLMRAPSALGEFLSVWFRAAGANTIVGPTLNVNGLGVKALKKQQGGAKVDLAIGDLMAGGEYHAIYDGTVWVVTNAPVASGLTSVSQGNLNTSTGSVSVTGTSANLVLPGGEYGFYPLIARTGGGAADYEFKIGYAVGVAAFGSRANIWLYSNGIAVATQRYVTASPPFDMGDGEVGGFLFGLVDAGGALRSTYMADVPPWAYNGPTNIRADYIDPKTGKKFRRVLEKLSIENMMQGLEPEWILEEITQDLKQADMALIPHPFGDVPDGCRVVLFDPMDDRIRQFIDMQNAGGGADILDAVHKGQLFCDNTQLRRKGPDGVHIGRLRYKNSRG